ncbi:endonuclease/exonuclease/phosphatase family protein [bacterium]|nr:endonuclease/exonuclease/phosphatase family protein [bacterium]
MRRWLLVLLLLAACGGGSGGGAPSRDLTMAQLNILHGTSGMCTQTANCRLADRIDLLFQWIARSGCPDVVTLQEVWSGALSLLQAGAAGPCPFTYEVRVATDRLGPDESAILSRYPVLSIASQPLFPGFRKVVHTRIDHPALGPVDVYSTHLASGSDGATVPCAANTSCPAACVDAGAQTRRQCQAVQMAQYIEATHGDAAPVLIGGDFNAEPGSFEYRQFVDRGWIDVHLASGNPECDARTGRGCTSGREDENLSELESRDSNEVERIDFIFVIPARDTALCANRLDGPRDDDGDGTATGLFAAAPNPFHRRCGAAPLPICWPSDHQGVQLDLNCD